MPEVPKPLEHDAPEAAGDEVLVKDARDHLARWPQLQLLAELVAKLRSLDLPWWSPESMRERWGATSRMRWYRQRPDLRQQVTSALTGLARNAARSKGP